MSWTETNLKKYIEVESGAAFKSEEFVENGIPVVKIANISNYTLIPTKGDSFIKETELEKYQNVVLSIGDVLIAMSGNTTCKMGRVSESFSPSLVNQRVGWIKPISDEIDINFVYHLLISDTYQKRLWNFATATGQPNLSPRDIKRISFVKPPKPEQTAIATLLSKVDEAIAATQNSIKAAEKLKKALMQNLLTGKLKPDGSWRTEDEFYEDEKFGKVPLGWEVKKGKKIFQSYGSSSFDNINLSNQGDCIYMKVSDFSLEGNELYIEKANIMFSYENNEGLKYCEPDYIVMSKRGEAIRKNRVRILAKKTLLDPNLMALKIIDGKPLFFKFLLEQMNLQRFLENSALPQLNNKDFYPRFYLYPLIEEQEEISNVLLNQHNLIRKKHFKIQTLQRLKKSLMQNLLTGKVRLPAEFIATFENSLEEAN